LRAIFDLVKRELAAWYDCHRGCEEVLMGNVNRRNRPMGEVARQAVGDHQSLLVQSVR